MNWIFKNWPAVLLLVAGIFACIATFVSSKQDVEQKKNIEELGKANLKLSGEIQELDNLNNSISQKIQDIATENLKLTNKTSELVSEVKKLSISNNKITATNNELSEQTLILSKLIRDLNTGGDSTYIAPSILFDTKSIAQLVSHPEDPNIYTRNSLLISFYNKGGFALDNVKIHFHVLAAYRIMSPMFLARQCAISFNIYDFFYPSTDNTSKKFLADDASKAYPFDYTKDFDVFKPAQSYVATLECSSFFGIDSYAGYDVFIESKRQNWVILIRCYKPPDKSPNPPIYTAFKILRVTGKGFLEIETYVQDEFPKEADGSVKWYNEEMPPWWIIKNYDP